MNKLKIKLVAISLLVISTIAVAEDTQTDISKFGLNWNTIPVLCGNAEQLDRYLKEYNFELENASVGRENAKEDGKPVYGIMYYINKDRTQTIPMVFVPGQPDACFMYRSFDLKEDLKN